MALGVIASQIGKGIGKVGSGFVNAATKWLSKGADDIVTAPKPKPKPSAPKSTVYINNAQDLRPSTSYLPSTKPSAPKSTVYINNAQDLRPSTSYLPSTKPSVPKSTNYIDDVQDLRPSTSYLPFTKPSVPKSTNYIDDAKDFVDYSVPSSAGTRAPRVDMPQVTTPTPGTGMVDDVVSVADDAVNTSRGLSRFKFKPTKLGVLDTALTAASFGIEPFENVTGIDVPPWLESAILLGGGYTGTKYGIKGVKGAANIKNPIVRGAAKTGANILKYTSIPLAAGGSALAFMGDGEPEIVTEESVTPGVSPFQNYVTPQVAPDEGVSMIDEVLGNIDQANAELVAGYNQDMSTLDAEFEAAMSELMAIVNKGLDPNDPILQQELANIEQQYALGKQSIDAEYSAAAEDIQGYQAQADELMQELGQGLAESYEQASGELLQAPATPGVTGEQAMAAGVSDTALGGAGVTGAAMLGAQQGATEASLTANRLTTASSMYDSLGKLERDQASMNSALQISRLEAERGAKLSSAERKAVERENARQAQLMAAQLKLDYASKKADRQSNQNIAIAQANSQSYAQKADFLSRLDPEDYKKWKGSGGVLFDGSIVGSWSYPGGTDPLAIPKIPGLEGKEGVTLPNNATVDMILQQYDMQALDIVASASSREDAINDAMDFLSQLVDGDPNAIAVLSAYGRPTSPVSLVDSLITKPPSTNPVPYQNPNTR